MLGLATKILDGTTHILRGDIRCASRELDVTKLGIS